MNQTKGNSRNNKRRWPWFVGGLCAVVLAGGLLAWQYVNDQAHLRMLSELRQATGLSVDVGDTAVQRGGIETRDVTIGDKTSPVLSAEKMFVEVPIHKLARDKPPIDAIRFQGAKLELKVAEDGSLQWPFKPSAGELPGDRVEFTNATVIISQPSRDDLSVTGVDLVIIKQESSVQIDGVIGSFFNSRWDVSGTATFDQELDVTLSTANISVGSKELATKAVIAPFVSEATFELAGSAQVNVIMSGKRSTFRSMMELRNASLTIPEVELNLSDVTTDVELTADEIVVRDFSASVGGGQLDGETTVDVRQSPYQGRFELAIEGVPARAVRALTRIPDYFDGNATGEIRGEFRLAPDVVEMSLNGKGWIKNAMAKDIPLDSVTTELSIRQLRLGGHGPPSIQGEVQLRDVVATDVPIAKVLKLLPESVADAMPNASGQVSAHGQLLLPLQTAQQPETWNATADVNSETLVVLDQALHAVSGELELANGQLVLSNMEIELGQASKLSGSAYWSLDGTQPSQLLVAARDISAGMIAGLLRKDPDESTGLAGEIDMDAALQIPANREFDASNLSGEVAVSSQRLAWNGAVLNDLSSVSRIADAHLVVEQFSARTALGGMITAKGTIPFDGQQTARAELTGARIPMTDLLHLGKRVNHDLAEAFDHVSLAGDEPSVGGNLSIAARVAVRVADAKLASAWSGHVRCQSSDATFFSTDFTSAGAEIVLDDGQVQLRTLRAQLVDGGEVAGQALFPLSANDADARAAVRWNHLPIESVAWLTRLAPPLTGQTSGSLKISARNGKLDDIAAIDGSGEIVLTGASLAGSTFADISADIRLTNNRLKLQGIKIGAAQTPVARFAMEMKSPYTYLVEIAASDVGLGDYITRINGANSDGKALSVEGIATIKARLSGDFEGSELSARGQLGVRQLRIGRQQLSDIAVRVANVKGKADRVRLVGDAFGGRLAATVDLPNSQAANKRIDIAFERLELAEFEWLTAVLVARGMAVSGMLDGSATIESWDDAKVRTANLKTRNVDVRLAEIEVESLDAELSLKDRTVEYSLSGQALDGELSVTGEARLADGFVPEVIQLDIHLHEAKLQSLGRQSVQYAKLKQLTGAADLQLNLQLAAPDFTPTGNGTVSARGVAWGRKSVSANAQSQLVVGNGLVRLQELRAFVGKGTVHGTVDLPLPASQGGSYDLIARRIDLATLLQFTGIGTGRSHGSIDARLSGTVGSQIRGRGKVELRRGAVGRVSAGTMRIPVTYVLNTKDLTGRVATRRMTVGFADGQITSDATIDFGRRLDLDAECRISSVDSGELFQNLAGVRDFDQGELSGTLQVTGNGVRSLRDLRGRFLGKLEGSQSLQLPLLNDLAAFANVGQASRTSFDSGKIDLRMDNGIISTPGFTLQSDQAELFIVGNVNINQRIDLDVALQAGNIQPSFGLDSLVGSPATSLVAPGAGAYVQAAEFLSSRVIYLHVGGTFRSPHFQLRTDRMLRDELLRYFLPEWQYRQIRDYR